MIHSLLPAGEHRDLHSFPTRRSSDLLVQHGQLDGELVQLRKRSGEPFWAELSARLVELDGQRCSAAPARSEEHTSELQSLAYLVCRRLLEKKKLSTGLSS